MSIYVNIFLSPFMYCYFYYVHLFLENGSFFWYYIFKDGFGITWTIIYSKKLHSLRTSVELFCIFCWNSSLLRAVKPCLKKIYKDVFCINLMLTPLFFFHKCSSPVGHFGVPFDQYCGIFTLFREKSWVYILDNNLMVVRLEEFLRGVALCLGVFWVWV